MITSNPNHNAATGTFTGVLGIARRFWEQVDTDPAMKTARGLYFAADDVAHTVDLTYSDNSNRLRLELRLKPTTDPETISSRLIDLQDRWACLLASVTYAREDHLIRIQAKTHLELTQKPDSAVRAIFDDLKSIVSDR